MICKMHLWQLPPIFSLTSISGVVQGVFYICIVRAPAAPASSQSAAQEQPHPKHIAEVVAHSRIRKCVDADVREPASHQAEQANLAMQQPHPEPRQTRLHP